jgi:hypothetical protein
MGAGPIILDREATHWPALVKFLVPSEIRVVSVKVFAWDKGPQELQFGSMPNRIVTDFTGVACNQLWFFAQTRLAHVASFSDSPMASRAALKLIAPRDL